MMLGREQFVELGGFREDYHSGFEDFDLCRRSAAGGAGADLHTRADPDEP